MFFCKKQPQVDGEDTPTAAGVLVF